MAAYVASLAVLSLAAAAPRTSPASPQVLKSASTGKCLVNVDTAWPRLGDCNSPDVLQIYPAGSRLRTKAGKCMTADPMVVGPSWQTTMLPYVIDCTWDQVAPPENKDFVLPLANGQLRLAKKNMCLEVIDPAPKNAYEQDTHFVPCIDPNLRSAPFGRGMQDWQLTPLSQNGGNVCRKPGGLGEMERTSKTLSNGRTRFAFKWGALPDDVNEKDAFSVKICLESFPAGKDMVVQCVTRKNWTGMSFDFDVPTSTDMCRRHFTVTYSTKCGEGKTTPTQMGCAGRTCARVCSTKGSAPALKFPSSRK
eukprot:comp24847_c0_seq1/m.46893 comp24847_c0_seq1/g.46893  ORF comp24847_c0_seq1/g.46893 comp24847_c0_seq1/m.46893 type:complete len:307 (-) comp24847_c0_seq1:322-1242(-)